MSMKKILENSFKYISLLLLCFISLNLAAESRKALVIGNSNYMVKPLTNPVNDANDITQILTGIGFQVTKLTNASRSEMRNAIDHFGKEIKNIDTALVFYAGHGVQVSGKNYLIPIDADIKQEHQVEDRAVSLNNILGYMKNSGSKVNIVLLDACRDNPLKSAFRSTSRGLARVDGPTGTYIAFATAEGKVAADGNGRNGLFTSKLLKHIPTPNLSLDQIMTKVRVEVMDESQNEQVPWSNSSMTRDFYFLGNSRLNPTDTQPLSIVTNISATRKLPVTIRSNVHNDQVYIDGKSYGSTKLDLSLPVGEYKIVINKSGYQNFESTLSVTMEKENVLFAKLIEEESLFDNNDIQLAEKVISDGIDEGVISPQFPRHLI